MDKTNFVQLVVDAGNTLIKCALFHEDRIVDKIHLKGKSLSGLGSYLTSLEPPVTDCILSCVRSDEEDLIETILHSGIGNILLMRSGLELPIRLFYKTPETLGTDRLANACMAAALGMQKNMLVVDIGTCIKYDIVLDGRNYMGGAISPGLKMRYKSLSSFTGKLPYLKNTKPELPELLGISTEGSMRSGVENGMIHEINGMISEFEMLFGIQAVILTGGDSSRFQEQVKKSSIFVEPDLTIKGLYEILKINASK